MVVDDHPVIRRGLRALLESELGFQVVGEAGDGFHALRLFENIRPMVVLLDMMMKGVDGIEVTKQIIKSSPATAIIIFSVVGSEHHVLEALHAGARGYVLKESSSEELIHAIHEVASGGRFLCSQLTEQPYLQRMTTYNSSDLYSRLTPRERVVLGLSAQGNTCAEIAEKLAISRRTVEVHRANMMHKLGLSNQAALLRYAFQNGLAFNNNYLEVAGKK